MRLYIGMPNISTILIHYSAISTWQVSCRRISRASTISFLSYYSPFTFLMHKTWCTILRRVRQLRLLSIRVRMLITYYSTTPAYIKENLLHFSNSCNRVIPIWPSHIQTKLVLVKLSPPNGTHISPEMAVQQHNKILRCHINLIKTKQSSESK